MLPTTVRLHTAEEFAAVLRRGTRAGTPRLVLHLAPSGKNSPARAGFIVSGKIGNSVVRHRIIRRLRPLVRRELKTLSAGTDLVIRALAPAGTASSWDLDRDLRAALSAATRKAGLPGRSEPDQKLPVR